MQLAMLGPEPAKRVKTSLWRLYEAVNCAVAMPCTSNSDSVKLPDLTSCGQVASCNIPLHVLQSEWR